MKIKEKLNNFKNSIITNLVDNLVDRLKHEIFYEEGFINMQFSPQFSLQKEAHLSTINFIKNNMDLNRIIMKPKRLSHLQYALSKIESEGLFLEFGVWSGKTINLAAKKFPNKIIYGFDSFEGLPEDWSGWSCEASTFKINNLPNVEPNVHLIKGWFNETLPLFLQEYKDKISYLHVDSDIYSSAIYVLTSLAERLQPGTIIVFDEFFNYPNWENHEYKAFMEFCEKFNVKFEYISIGYQQVAVRIL